MVMEKFVIEGGQELSGTINVGGSKNEALPVIAATLLSTEPVVLRRVPKIADVHVMLEILVEMGADAEWMDNGDLQINCANVQNADVPQALCRQLRASILLAGPLLARFGYVRLPPPGGDVIGRRRLDTHFLGFESLGATIDVSDVFEIRAAELRGADIFLDEPSVTGTENIIMAAVRAKGVTLIGNAACEPHVQGLCRMLNTLGAQITGIGTNSLTIKGTPSLWGGGHTIGPDYLEVGSFIGLAAMTKSALKIGPAEATDLRMIRLVFNKLGVDFDIEDGEVIVPKHETLTIRSDYQNRIPVIDDAPWPAFPTDMMSIAITVATQAVGSILFFEKMFDGRMFFTDSLNAMGAKIILCDPHRVVVNGPSQLVGSTLESPDVRAGMALLIASLSARGTSTIYNVRHIDRGYEMIDEKLRNIGARIERLPA